MSTHNNGNKNSYYGPGTEDLTFTPLTLAEERALFDSFYAGSLPARDKLITNHLRWAAKMGLSCARRMLQDDDAISAANMGLIKALEARSFDQSKGFRFTTYARFYIKESVMKRINEQCVVPNLERVGTAQHKEYFSDDGVLTGVLASGAPGSNINNAGSCYTTTCTGFKPLEEVPHVWPSMEDDDLNAQRRVVIDKALARLKPTERAAVTKILLQGFANVEAAVQLGITRQGCQRAFRRAMAKLRGMKDELGGSNGELFLHK
jgi:RNA polymerase sigma factor (sigma-70 family)